MQNRIQPIKSPDSLLYPREEVEQRIHFGDKIALRRNSAFIFNFHEMFKFHPEYTRNADYSVHLLNQMNEFCEIDACMFLTLDINSRQFLKSLFIYTESRVNFVKGVSKIVRFLIKY